MKILIIYIGVLAAAAAGGQDSLSHYLMIAARNNPVVLQQYDAYRAALEKVPQVASLPDPALTMGIFLSPMELVGGNQVADLQLMQMFPWFGTLRAARDEMSLMANATFESFRDSKLQLFYEVQETWYALISVQQYIEIARKSMDILQTIGQLALAKFSTASSGAESLSPAGNSFIKGGLQAVSGISSGMQSMNTNPVATAGLSAMPTTSPMQGNSMGSSSPGFGLKDLYHVQIEIGDLENNIALLKNRQNTLTARFNRYLNRPAMTPVALPDTLVMDTLGLPLQAIEDSMLSGNPMLRMLHYEQQSLESRKRMVNKMGYPMVGLGLNYSVIRSSEMSVSEMNGQDMIMPMISISLPVYRKKYKAMRNEADLLKTAVSYRYSAAENDLKAEYYQAVQNYEDAQRRVKLYSGQRLLVISTFDIMLKGYAATGSDLTEIMRLRQQILDYSYKEIEAMTDYNISIALLRRLGSLEMLSRDDVN
jgi:outer membrane protein TolC